MDKDFFEILIRAGLLTLCLLTGMGLCIDVHAGTVGEYTIKSALILNFARFTDWPPEAFANSPDTLHICIVGDDAVVDAFAGIKGKRVGERHLAVRKVRSTRELQDCHLLFVSGSNRGRLPQIFAAVKGKPILTIGEMADFAKLGGIINLVKVERKIRFEVNLDAARRAGLKISSRILKLATLVGGSQREKRK
jgi:hypothetical protein